MGRLKTVVSGLILFAAGYATATLSGFAPSSDRSDSGCCFGPSLKRYIEGLQEGNKGHQGIEQPLRSQRSKQVCCLRVSITSPLPSVVSMQNEISKKAVALIRKHLPPSTQAQPAAKIKENLDADELGRLRYKKNVIRLYSQERLQMMFKLRDQLEIRSESAE
jgi:hypothetical protein